MSLEDTMELIDKIEKDGYIDCTNAAYDNDQYKKIVAALKQNISLQQRVDELAKDNSNLLLGNEVAHKRFDHLFKSRTILSYDEVKNREYIKNINELDSFMTTCNEMICRQLLEDETVNRIDDFKVERKKNDIKLVYDPIEKPIALQITVVENDKNEVCPICGQELGQYPALSRKDNETKICSNCGMIEALEAFNNSLKDAESNE